MKYAWPVFVCLTAVLCAAPVAAQPSESPERTPVVSAADAFAGLRVPMAVWAAAVGADHVTTFQFRTQYPALLHEMNPIVRPLENHPAWMVAANTALDAATAWAVYRWLGLRHPRIAKAAFYTAGAYRVYLSAHNVRMMQRAREMSVNTP